MAINNTFLTGIDSTQFTLDAQAQIINAIHDGDGTIRLCVSQGIPKQSQVTNFQNVTYQMASNGAPELFYTEDGGKTFYVMNILASNFDAIATQGAILTIVDNLGSTVQTIKFALAVGSQVSQNGYFPIIIIPSGYKAYLGVNGALGNSISVSLIGYDEFGLTS